MLLHSNGYNYRATNSKSLLWFQKAQWISASAVSEFRSNLAPMLFYCEFVIFSKISTSVPVISSQCMDFSKQYREVLKLGAAQTEKKELHVRIPVNKIEFLTY